VLLHVDPDEYLDYASRRLASDAESIIVLANPVQPHSEGESCSPSRTSRSARQEGHGHRPVTGRNVRL
jgi:hypothetical protein